MKRNGRIILVLASLLVSGCVTERPPPATEQEKSETGMAYISCLHEQAQKLDDRKSDAATVALGVENACAAQSARNREIYSRDLAPAAKPMYEARMASHRLDLATRVVLEERNR